MWAEGEVVQRRVLGKQLAFATLKADGHGGLLEVCAGAHLRCFSVFHLLAVHCRAPRPHARPLPPAAFLSFVRSPSLPTPLLAPTALRQRTSYPFRCAAACVRVFARRPSGGKLTAGVALRGADQR